MFDYHVRDGMGRYLGLQTLYTLGRGPRVSIDSLMRPAVATGALKATAAAVAVLVLGGTALVLARRADRS